LEDPGKNTVSHNKRAKAVKEKRPHASTFHIMISRGVGKVRNFSISPRIIFVSFVFFALYIIASVFVINDYFDKLHTNRDQAVKLERLQKQIENTRRLHFRSEQRLALMQEYVNNTKSGVKISREPVHPVETASAKAEQANKMKVKEVLQDGPKEGQLETKAEEGLQEESKEGLVEIKDVATSKEDAKLTVSFKIVNIDQGDEPLRGYVHIIVTDKESDTPQYWTYPKVALRDGLPIEYKRGRLFVIKRFRTIRGEFFLDSNTESPLSLKIIVYNQAGNLILQREIEAEITS
jgi:hypothetical protein